MRLLQLARELLPQVAAAERDLVRIIEGEAGELRLAVECHTCFDWLMPAMGEFRPLWPQVELDIVSGFQADPVGLLLQHRADLAIVSEAEPLNGISYRPLFAYEMVGICAEDHPIAIIQLVASKRGIAALPYWTVMPYLEKGYVVHRKITSDGLQSKLYAAIRTEDANKGYLDNFCQITHDRCFADLPGLNELEM